MRNCTPRDDGWDFWHSRVRCQTHLSLPPALPLPIKPTIDHLSRFSARLPRRDFASVRASPRGAAGTRGVPRRTATRASRPAFVSIAPRARSGRARGGIARGGHRPLRRRPSWGVDSAAPRSSRASSSRGGGRGKPRARLSTPARALPGRRDGGERALGKLEWNFSQVFGERTPGEEVQDGAFESRGAARARWRVFSFSLAIADARAPPPPRVSVARARGDRAARAAGARSAPPTPRNPGHRARPRSRAPGTDRARSIPPGRRARTPPPPRPLRARVARSNETRPRVILGVGFWGKTVRALVVVRVPEASSRRGRPPSFASLKNAPRPSPPPPEPPLPPSARASLRPSPPPPSSSLLFQPTSSPRWSLTNPGSTSRRAIAAVASSYSSVFIRARTRPRRRVGARATTPRTRLGSEYRRWSTAT